MYQSVLNLIFLNSQVQLLLPIEHTKTLKVANRAKNELKVFEGKIKDIKKEATNFTGAFTDKRDDRFQKELLESLDRIVVEMPEVTTVKNEKYLATFNEKNEVIDLKLLA